MTTNEKLWSDIQLEWKLAFPELKPGIRQEQLLAYWKDMKARNGNKINVDEVKAKIVQLKMKRLSRPNPIASLFSRSKTSVPPKSQVTSELGVADSSELTAEPNPIEDEDEDIEVISAKKKRIPPVQTRLIVELETVRGKVSLRQAKNAGVTFTEPMTDNLKTLVQKKSSMKNRLNKLRKQQKYSAAHRIKKNLNILKSNQVAPNVEEIDATRPKLGKPRLEENQPELLKTIVALVNGTAAADPRRRFESLRTCRTLDDLHHELLKLGFKLSRTALYLRLQPHRPSSNEGKRHINTVPVRLIKAQNDGRTFHEDAHFAAAKSFLRMTESIPLIELYRMIKNGI